MQNYGTIATSQAPGNSFSPTEFISLKENIYTNIIFVKSRWQKIEKTYAKIIGTSKDSQQVREKVHKVQIATNEKIQTTSNDLKRLAQLTKRGDKNEKLQVSRLTTDFRHVVQKYQACQKELAIKMKMSLLVDVTQMDDLLLDSNQDVSGNDLQKQLVHRNLQFGRQMLENREQNFLQIERDVLDINEIMSELSSLVNEQTDQIDTIALAVEDGTENIVNGTEELEKAAANQKKFRRKVFTILAIAIILGLIVVISLVSSFKT